VQAIRCTVLITSGAIILQNVASQHFNFSFVNSYNMLLNITSVEDADPETLLRESFNQYKVLICNADFCRDFNHF